MLPVSLRYGAMPVNTQILERRTVELPAIESDVYSRTGTNQMTFQLNASSEALNQMLDPSSIYFEADLQLTGGPTDECYAACLFEEVSVSSRGKKIEVIRQADMAETWEQCFLQGRHTKKAKAEEGFWRCEDPTGRQGDSKDALPWAFAKEKSIPLAGLTTDATAG